MDHAQQAVDESSMNSRQFGSAARADEETTLDLRRDRVVVAGRRMPRGRFVRRRGHGGRAFNALEAAGPTEVPRASSGAWQGGRRRRRCLPCGPADPAVSLQISCPT